MALRRIRTAIADTEPPVNSDYAAQTAPAIIFNEERAGEELLI
jgi:hypothetical protein